MNLQRRRALFRWFRAAAAGALVTVGCDPAPPSPNLVLITIDTLRADRLGCYGYFRNTSPAIDRMAEQSIVFDDALSHMGTTLPSHVSLMTGTRTITHGVHSNQYPFRSDRIRTLAQILGESGYATAAFISATPLKPATGIDVGFHQYSAPEDTARTADATTDSVLVWLDAPHDGPFFLWVHYFDPHMPCRAPDPWYGTFTTDEEQLRYLEAGAFVGWKTKFIQERNNRYDEEVAFADHHVGRILDRLREMGLYDEAVVVLTSDHGEALGQHNHGGHNGIYAEILRVPLLLKLPGAGNGDARRHGELTALADVLPILADEMRLPLGDRARGQFEGRNVLRDSSPHDVLSERARGHKWVPEWGEKFALTTDRWTYHYMTTEDHQLFDRHADPLELANVIDRQPDVARAMQERVEELLASRSEPAPDPSALPEGHLEELRALGYVD